MNVIRSVDLFIAARLAETGGGYLIWRWLRRALPGRPGWRARPSLIAYGVIPALQARPASAASTPPTAGVFVIMSLLWGWGIDHHRPDNHHWLEAAIVAADVA